MGHKTASPGLRLTLNRGFDQCWYQEPNAYSTSFLKDHKYREYLHDIFSKLPPSVSTGRIFSSILPKKYEFQFFAFQNLRPLQKQRKGYKRKMAITAKKQQPTKNSVESNAYTEIFKDVLRVNLRNKEFGGTSENCVKSHVNELKVSYKHSLLEQAGQPSYAATNLEELYRPAYNWNKCATKLSVVYTPHFESSAHHFNNFLIDSFKSGKPARKDIKKCLMIAQKSPNIKGIRITCSGRFNGVDRAKVKTHTWGQTSLQTFDGRLDYSCKAAHTKVGFMGIKVWILYQ